ncbi:protein FAM98B [Halyomorpha halys]|uniref:protein FAM98B n=1 Tax=Halyomorpha halys TaxID=286706 RepID=UPI0006D4E0C4|nr:protein FAM98A [Halyomorpha halys]
MDLDVLDGLTFIQYPLDEASLRKVVEEWPVSIEFTKLVEWLTKELQYFCNLEEHVNAISISEDASSFLLELSSFLKELGCSYKTLTEGNVGDRLKTSNDRYLLLEFLISEVLAARITSAKKPSGNNIELTLNESDNAASMRKMLMALNFPKPPTNITAQMLFTKVQNKVKELSDKCINDPLFSGLLSPKQWTILSQLQDDLKAEYRIRRQMLLKRLDVTIQSFQWSDRMKGKENEIAKLYLDKRKALVDEPSVALSDLLSARAHLAVLEKTSNANVRKNTQSSLNKVIIGRVPDRGGRPQDQQPPPPEMPSWAPRANQPQGGFGGDGGRGGGRGGGRVQGGWNSSGDGYSGSRGHQDNFQGRGRGYQDNYQGGGGNYYQGGGGNRGRGGRGRDRDRY